MSKDNKQIRKYSLVAIKPDTNQQTLFGIEIDELNIPYITNKKSLLPEIDLYTMQHENVNDLEWDFLEIGELGDDVAFYITYKANGDKKTDVLYKKDIKMLPFAEERSNNISTSSQHFYKLLNFVESKGEDWLNFMHHYGYINDHMYENLFRLRSNAYNRHAEESLIDDLSTYKAVRNIYIGNEKYKRKEYSHESDVDLTSGDYVSQAIDALDTLYEEDEPIEDQSYKDYADEKWHK